MIAQMDRSYVRLAPWRVLPRLISYVAFEGRPLTTRGRWINPFVFTLVRGLARLPFFSKPLRTAFVVGTGRSGTTLLGIILSAHRGVGFLNEPKAVWHAAYRSEDVIGNYTNGPARFSLSAEDVSIEAKNLMQRVYVAYAFAVGAELVVDKYPELVFRISFVREIFPSAKFVLLTRNGNDVVASIDSWSKQHGEVVDGENHNWWGRCDRKWRLMCEELIGREKLISLALSDAMALDSHSDRAALEWILTMKTALHQVRKYPNIFITIRYEDLLARPRQVIGRLFTDLGLSQDENCLSYAEAVVRPANPPVKPIMSSKLIPYFDEVMCELGYA